MEERIKKIQKDYDKLKKQKEIFIKKLIEQGYYEENGVIKPIIPEEEKKEIYVLELITYEQSSYESYGAFFLNKLYLNIPFPLLIDNIVKEKDVDKAKTLIAKMLLFEYVEYEEYEDDECDEYEVFYEFIKPYFSLGNYWSDRLGTDDNDIKELSFDEPNVLISAKIRACYDDLVTSLKIFKTTDKSILDKTETISFDKYISDNNIFQAQRQFIQKENN